MCDCYNCKRTLEFKPFLYAPCLNKEYIPLEEEFIPLEKETQIINKYSPPHPDIIHNWGFKQIKDEDGNFIAWDLTGDSSWVEGLTFQNKKDK